MFLGIVHINMKPSGYIKALFNRFFGNGCYLPADRVKRKKSPIPAGMEL